MSYTNSQFTANHYGPKGNLGDFQHASRVFVTNNYELAPKTKFLYHVNFNFNPPAIMALGIDKELLSVLVKTVELPTYNIQTETLNQYNRKRITQVKVDYQPISITFHDDNNNVVQDLWEYYFAYHFSDSATAKFDPIRYAAFTRNAMDDISGKPTRLFKYGYDTGNLFRFFNSIEVFQMTKQSWSRYVLVNPVILSWNHDKLDYSSSQPAEQRMSVGYEAVGYSNGDGQPDGFPTSRYDTVPSPLSLGSSGMSGGANRVFDQTSSSFTTAQPIPREIAMKQLANYQNTVDQVSSSPNTLGGTINNAVSNLGRTANSANNFSVSFNMTESPPFTLATQIPL